MPNTPTITPQPVSNRASYRKPEGKNLPETAPDPAKWQNALFEELRRRQARLNHANATEWRVMRALEAMYEARKAAALPGPDPAAALRGPDPAALPNRYGACEVCGVTIGAISRRCLVHRPHPLIKPRRD